MGELQGRVFGGYQLLDEIGGGGVGEVYRARPAAGAGREVVVKVIFQEFARQPGFARNFAYVTEVSTRLASHPHILPLVAHGEEGEYLYLVTPYVQAGTLADWIAKGGRLSVADVGPFFQQLCGALSYAHSLGVVHGNLKPSNIYLHEGRHLLLGDFGLLWDVRALDASWSGSGVEAFEYLAPEVFAGQITQAGDIYSLGATLFHSLTGHTPFHTSKLGDLIAAAQQQPVPSLGQQQPPVAPAIVTLDAVVAQAMAKRPNERFASAVLLAQGIEGTLHQAVAQGLGAQAPGAQLPQAQMPWQPLAPVYPPGLAPGLTPGLAAAAAGIAPLGQFDAPFPPLPPSALVDGAMDLGGAALSSVPGYGMSSSHVIEPTMRMPAPVPAPGGISGAMPGYPEADTQVFDEAAAQPITAPRQSAALAGERSGPIGQAESNAPDGLAPLDPTQTTLDASLRRISQRLPAVQRDAAGDAAAQSGQFSSTELGLPRLTNPALGNLPADWQQLLTDESAHHRHDPFAATKSGANGANGGSGGNGRAPSAATSARSAPFDADGFSASGDNLGQSGLLVGSWSASDPARQWDAPAPADARPFDAYAASNAALAETPRKRSRKVDYSNEDLSERAGSRNGFDDTLQEQRVWTNSRSVVRIGQSVSRAPIVIFLLALAVLVELAGFAVARPDLCVTHACSVVAGQIEKIAPNLRIPGAPAPIKLAPSALAVSAATNGQSAIQVKMSNTASRAVSWSATTTLGWLSVSPPRGSLAQGASVTLTLTAQPDGVSPGGYVAGLIVDAATGQSVTPVALRVTQGPVLSVTTKSLAFTTCGDSQALNITNTGGAKLTYTATPSQASALGVSPGSGSLAPGAKATLSVTLYCGATTGQQYAVILVSSGGSAQTLVTYG